MSPQNFDFASMVQRLEGLERRNERLERQARWMKMGAMLLLISFGVVFGVGAAQDRGEVRAKRFVLEDPRSDKIRGEFVVDRGDATLKLFDRNEHISVLLMAGYGRSSVGCMQYRPEARSSREMGVAFIEARRDRDDEKIGTGSIVVHSSDGKEREILPEGRH